VPEITILNCQKASQEKITKFSPFFFENHRILKSSMKAKEGTQKRIETIFFNKSLEMIFGNPMKNYKAVEFLLY